MKYTQKSFSVGGSSKTYSDNFDRIFRQCPSEFEFCGHTYRCELKRNVEHEAHKAPLVDGEKPTDYVSWSTDGKESFVYETLVVK